MNVHWIVTLSEEEAGELERLEKAGSLGVRKLKRVMTLRMAHEGYSIEESAKALKVGTSTVYRTRRRYVEEGLEAALNERGRPGGMRKLSANDEATLVALACCKSPKGRSSWTMQLLADHLVAMTDLESVSSETIRRRLNEKQLKPWQHKMWCIPDINAEYVARMEDVLALYAEPDQPEYPVVNFDETPFQLLGETRVPIAAAPGQPARVDYEYRRNGTANLFITFDRHRGFRHVEVTSRRTTDDFADQMQKLVDELYPHAKTIRVVLDNLNTHRIAALYERFEPAEARRIASKLEFHFTPKHASWLNMVEIEIGVLNKQCLSGRIPSIEVLCEEVGAWQASRNEEGASIEWLFDIDRARAKLGSRYPSPSLGVDCSVQSDTPVDQAAHAFDNEQVEKTDTLEAKQLVEPQLATSTPDGFAKARPRLVASVTRILHRLGIGPHTQIQRERTWS